jgi:hypothetical protein
MEDIYMKVTVELYNVQDQDGFEVALNWYSKGIPADNTTPPDHTKRVRIRGKYPDTDMKEKIEELAAWCKLAAVVPRNAPILMEDVEDEHQ